jgi:norsolorinic acid ketoreductase
MAPTIVLITGTTRGIGKGLLELYLKKPNHIVIAGNRDPSDSKSTSLHSLPKAEGTTLEIVKIEATSPTDAALAADEITAKFGHIDILVANSGIANLFPKFVDVTIEDVKPHIEVNYFGFIRLYQAFRPLLKKAKDPKWVTIGSSAGFLTVNMKYTPNSYSKKSANFYASGSQQKGHFLRSVHSFFF